MSRLRTAGVLLAFAVPLAAQQPIDVRARTTRPGDVFLVTVASGVAPSVRVFDRDWPAYPASGGTWRALVGIDLDTKPGRYELTVRMGESFARRTVTVQPRVFPTRRLSVDPDLVHPPADQQARIERETREVSEIWDHPAPKRLWGAPFEAPVPDAANSAFGTRSLYNGEARSPHTGADFLSPAGRPIHAPNDGRVVLAAPLYFSGNTVIIDHGLGVFSLLAHLSEIDVKAGDTVTRGELVGKVGATGRVTGPHLHWAVRVGHARVDPLALLAVAGSTAGGPRQGR